jgi:hypothetical protein
MSPERTLKASLPFYQPLEQRRTQTLHKRESHKRERRDRTEIKGDKRR